MRSHGFTYVTADTPVHRCDARAKIIALLVFSITLFAPLGWLIVLPGAVAVCALMVIARIPAQTMVVLLGPVYPLALVSVLCNTAATPNVTGLLAGLFFAVRMIVLVAGSYIVCLTTTSGQLLDAFGVLMGPLRAFHVPVDDISLTLSLSIRFIPVIQEELARIRAAQLSRGGQSVGSAHRRLRVWGSAFSALFIGLFRHADTLAAAMDARCYGAAQIRTRLK